MKIVSKALVVDADNNVLLLRRSNTHPNFPNHVDFPGGEVEEGEQYIAAVQREILEEIGATVNAENIEQIYSKQLADDLLHVVFMAKLSDNDKPLKLSWEHSSCEWLPMADFISMPLPEGVDSYHLTVLEYLKHAQN